MHCYPWGSSYDTATANQPATSRRFVIAAVAEWPSNCFPATWLRCVSIYVLLINVAHYTVRFDYDVYLILLLNHIRPRYSLSCRVV